MVAVTVSLCEPLSLLYLTQPCIYGLPCVATFVHSDVIRQRQIWTSDTFIHENIDESVYWWINYGQHYHCCHNPLMLTSLVEITCRVRLMWILIVPVKCLPPWESAFYGSYFMQAKYINIRNLQYIHQYRCIHPPTYKCIEMKIWMHIYNLFGANCMNIYK